ncbi:MAG: hypothetical protein ACREK8_08085 [Gemmatimonadales bacterium]
MNRSESIITSAPVRLDFAGAWTDVAPFATIEHGAVVNAAIDLRTRVELQLDQPRYDLWARDLDERAQADTPEQLGRDGRLELLKAAVRLGDLGPCRIHTKAEAPPGSGLGTSGALGVALVHAVDTALGAVRDVVATARAAWQMETVDAAVAGGQQDQFASAMGGFQHLSFDRGGTRAVALVVEPEFARELASHMLVCYTGRSRFSGNMITKVMQAYQDGEHHVGAALRALTQIGDAMAGAFRRHDLTAIGRLLAANWTEQQRLDPGMCTPEMSQLYDAMRSAGAVGGKAAGAGAGGSMFFVVPGDMSRAERMAREGGATLLPLRWAGRGVARD